MEGRSKNTRVDYEKYLANILQRGAYSRKQLEDKLRMRKCSAEEAELLLERFEDAGYVDDRAYSILYADSHPDWSSRRLKDELRARGVEEDNVKNALDEVEVDDEKRAARLAMDWAKAGLEERKIYGRLARRGFSHGLSRRASLNAVESL